MNKISVIIKREYVTRVRKKSFIIMTLLAPVLMAAIIILPTVFMATEKQEFKKIAIIETTPTSRIQVLMTLKRVLKRPDITVFCISPST
jgi:ABC-type Na+ efflux pump permease subunit